MAQSNGSSQEGSARHVSSTYLGLALSQVQNVSIPQLVLPVLIAWVFARNFLPAADGLKVPSVGYRSILEPSFLVRLRFALGALGQINEGYTKHKDSLFRVSRNDRDIFVIPARYVDELRNLPDETLSAKKAIYANHVGDYTEVAPVLQGHLHNTILQTRLTPSIPKLLPAMAREVQKAISTAIPECKDHWVEVSINDILLNLVTRVTNRVLLGDPDCYDEQWAKASMTYSANVTLTIGFLRLLPSFMRPLAALFLPPVRKVRTNVQLAKEALVPIIERRREAEANSADYGKPDDYLQWIMDAATGNDARPDNLAHRVLLVFLGAAHTSTMAGTHVFYDLCAMPQYFEPLRTEISDILKEDGGWSSNTAAKMRKMDSFLRESQRTGPNGILDFHRQLQKPLTLSDGTYLPAGIHLCTASYAISRDPANLPNAQAFDGFRYYELRKAPTEENKHQYATTDKNHMHFGRGKYACPGRFFASAELKVIIAHLLLEYEFQYPEGKGRPANLNADEFLYPDPSARLLIKQRTKAERTNQLET